MFVAIIFALIIVASIIFHFWSPWWWTPVASNWGNIDDTIVLSFWVTGAVFVAVCLFMAYCVWAYRYRPDRKSEDIATLKEIREDAQKQQDSWKYG